MGEVLEIMEEKKDEDEGYALALVEKARILAAQNKCTEAVTAQE